MTQYGYCDPTPSRKMCGRGEERRYASTILECLELKIPCSEVSDKCKTKAEKFLRANISKFNGQKSMSTIIILGTGMSCYFLLLHAIA
jgi:hypothetical protein